MKKNSFLSLILIFFFLATNYLKANEIYIVSRVNNQIIKNGDVQNEIKYLKLLNPSIKKMQKKELFFLSKNSLIREKIKDPSNQDLENNLKDLQNLEKQLNEIKNKYNDF